MALKVKENECPYCGATVPVDVTQVDAVCPYCDGEFTISTGNDIADGVLGFASQAGAIRHAFTSKKEQAAREERMAREQREYQLKEKEIESKTVSEQYRVKRLGLIFLFIIILVILSMFYNGGSSSENSSSTTYQSGTYTTDG